MFPDIEYEEIIEEETSPELGRIPLYDFAKNEYVVRDGKIIEATQDEAIQQWVAFLVQTKAEKYRVYDETEFGVYIENYIGYKTDNLEFVLSEIEREVTEKAELNRAISYIDNFEAEVEGTRMTISMTVHKVDETTTEVSVIV